MTLEAEQLQQKRSSRLFVALGVLWLLLGAAYFTYQLTNPTVEVTWETATELQTAGFNLYRSTTPDGELTLVNQAGGLIPGQGEGLTGASYTYTDSEVIAGQTYYYVLEEIEFTQNVNRYEDDVFAYTVPYVTVWTAVITAVTIVIGLALLVTGLREEREL